MTILIVAQKFNFSNKKIILELFNHNVSVCNQQQRQYSIRNVNGKSAGESINLAKDKFTNLKLKIVPKNFKFMTQNVIGNFFTYIEEISHMDDVRKAQNKVIQIKDTLKDVGDKKREILYELNATRNEIQKNHTEICNAMRGTERYISLVRDEMTLLNKEQKTQIEFTQSDELERGLFNNMTTAINDSYEKEKIHSNFIKVLGLIGTLTASIVTLIASAVGHYYHNTKFGLVANDFKENVNHTIKTEINTLKDSLRLDIMTAMSKQEELLKKLHQNKKKFEVVENKESWSSYIKRHTSNIFRYFTPKSYK